MKANKGSVVFGSIVIAALIFAAALAVFFAVIRGTNDLGDAVVNYLSWIIFYAVSMVVMAICSVIHLVYTIFTTPSKEKEVPTLTDDELQLILEYREMQRTKKKKRKAKS